MRTGFKPTFLVTNGQHSYSQIAVFALSPDRLFCHLSSTLVDTASMGVDDEPAAQCH